MDHPIEICRTERGRRQAQGEAGGGGVDRPVDDIGDPRSGRRYLIAKQPATDQAANVGVSLCSVAR